MSYKDLKSYQQETRVFDFTFAFVARYIDPKSRTKDQMEQAARSGKQNIVEGSSEKTSEKSELKLIGVARASNQELLEDFEDFLRLRNLQQWQKNSPEALEIRNQYKTNWSHWPNLSSTLLQNPAKAANAAICLIHQANFLLDRQIKALEEEFVEKGGYTEQLRQKREEEKKRQIVQGFRRKHFN